MLSVRNFPLLLKKFLLYLKKFFGSPQAFRFSLFIFLFFGLEKIALPAMLLFILWSMYLFAVTMMQNGNIKRLRYRKILYLFLAGAIVTVLFHAERNFFQNLFILYAIAIYFFQLYGIFAEKSNFRCRRELKCILTFIICATSGLMLLGFIGLAVFPQGLQWNDLHFILFESRFIGLLFNANVAGFYAAMAVIAAHILWRICRAENILSKKHKILLVISIVINVTALFLSDSNASLLFLVIYCTFVMFYILFRDFGKKRMHGFILRIAATALSFVVIIASMMFFRTFTQSRVSLAITSGHSETQLSTGIISENGIVAMTDDEDRENIFGHQNTNIDSGRFKIWTQALEMFEKFPLLGVGKANILDYAALYIGPLRYSDFHNGLITILISFGLVGFNLFIVFALTVARNLLGMIFRFKKNCRDDGSVPVLLIAFCIAYFIYSMFEVALLVDLSYRIYIFWLLTGFAMSYSVKYRRHIDLPDQSVTDLPSAVENIRKKHRLRRMLKKAKAIVKN